MIIEDEIKRQKLIDRIIREQDIVSFYANNNFNKSLGIMKTYDEGLYYHKIKDFIMENSQILGLFSIKNLFNILASVTSEEDIKTVNSYINKRLEIEEMFVEDIDIEFFMRNFYTSFCYRKIEEDTRKKLNERIVAQLKQLKGTKYEKIAENIHNYTDAINFLKYYNDGIFTDEKVDVINEMIDSKPHALDHVNFGLFKDDIFSMGKDFCKYISRFPSLSYQLIFVSQRAPNLLSIISNKISRYDKLEDNLDELEILITYSARNAFELQGIEIEEDEFIECAYRNSNDFELINVPYGENYKERLNKELEEKYKSAKNLNEKLNVYLNKVYSISLKRAKSLIKDYGSDLDNLNIPENIKGLFKELEYAIQLDDEKKVDELFSCGENKVLPSQIRKVKNHIAKECAKDFSKEFNKTSRKIDEQTEDISEIEFEGKKIKQIKLSGKFNLLLHSTDTGFIGETDETKDYKEEWNSNKDKKNHIISTTYVNQDFLGMAPVEKNGLRYAFAKLSEDKIRLMGVTDINTFSSEFAYDSSKRQYMSSKTLLYSSRRVYSEFGIKRESTEPDYVVVCDDDLEDVKKNSYKAAIQFGIPIIYINKQEIEQAQIQNLEQMLNEFKHTQDTEVLKRLINTFETNMAGWLLNRKEIKENDNSHTGMIDNSRFLADFQVIQEQIKDTVNTFLDNRNKDEEKDITDVIEILLREVELYDGCEETKPISKTKLSLNADELLQKANSNLSRINRPDLQVNIAGGERLREYKVKINDLVKKSLSGENAVTTELIHKTQEEIQRRKEQLRENNTYERPDDR